MFGKILYPTDFSDVATKALDYIKQLKEAGSQEVVILHVINQRIIDGLMRHAMLESDIENWRSKAREVADESMAEMRRDLEAIGFKVTCLVKTGFPWQKILAVEEAESPSVIVIGSHGRTNLGEVLLGSVSDRVIRKCRRPVLVVKRDTTV
ncbi:universal stress protein [uncultured Desulfosarcina sp.]|uniref:universal stress protein n=1 Tax=uncultured Desulfosarcina sp. TaxID=218289 RepID=UPI0029C7767F|nr:universal stress protein [uncultured Desulfosarcina sp.]